MIIKTRIFELTNGNYQNLSELAWAMGISVSQIYRVKAGKRSINQKFIIGAIKAFPEHKFDELFYLAPDSPLGNIAKTTVTKRHRHMVQYYTKPDLPGQCPLSSPEELVSAVEKQKVQRHEV